MKNFLPLLVVALAFPRAITEFSIHQRFRTRPDLGVAVDAFLLELCIKVAVALFLFAIVPGLQNGLGEVEDRRLTEVPVWAMMLAVAVIGPIAEDFIFNGVALTAYERRMRSATSALLVSALFGLIHASFPHALLAFIGGWVTAKAVQHTGSLWTGVLSHAINNFVVFGMLQMTVEDTSKGGILSVPLYIGLPALVFAGLCIWFATVWLRPKGVKPVEGGSVLSPSLAVLIAVVLIYVVYMNSR